MPPDEPPWNLFPQSPHLHIITSENLWPVVPQCTRSSLKKYLQSSYQCCRYETYHYGSGSNFSMSSGSLSGSYVQKVLESDPTFFLTKYYVNGPKMALQNIIFLEYLNLVYKNGYTTLQVIISVANPG
jgi:hypothetical protein